MRKTNCARCHIIISEAEPDYKVLSVNQEEAEKHAQEQAKTHPDKHFVVYAPVCGYVSDLKRT